MDHDSIGTYQSSLSELRRLSHELASHFETAANEEFVTHTSGFAELWARYKRALDECKRAYRLIPARHKRAVPRPPDH